MHLHKAREIRYQFIYDNSSEFRVEKMCKVLDIKRSSYYAWLKRPESQRKKDDSIFVCKIKRVHKESDGTYGARRVKAQLQKEGVACGKKQSI